MCLIVIQKSARTLTYQGTAYPIGLGGCPVGAKTKEGDGKTPEGEYFVCTKNGKSRFYLALGLSYPNEADAALALEEKRIDRETYARILNTLPPVWDTPLGGEIMIHGGGASDWTAGCIAVNNDVMDILFEACEIGTPVKILP